MYLFGSFGIDWGAKKHLSVRFDRRKYAKLYNTILLFFMLMLDVPSAELTSLIIDYVLRHQKLLNLFFFFWFSRLCAHTFKCRRIDWTTDWRPRIRHTKTTPFPNAWRFSSLSQNANACNICGALACISFFFSSLSFQWEFVGRLIGDLVSILLSLFFFSLFICIYNRKSYYCNL